MRFKTWRKFKVVTTYIYIYISYVICVSVGSSSVKKRERERERRLSLLNLWGFIKCIFVFSYNFIENQSRKISERVLLRI